MYLKSFQRNSQNPDDEIATVTLSPREVTLLQRSVNWTITRYLEKKDKETNVNELEAIEDALDAYDEFLDDLRRISARFGG